MNTTFADNLNEETQTFRSNFVNLFKKECHKQKVLEAGGEENVVEPYSAINENLKRRAFETQASINRISKDETLSLKDVRRLAQIAWIESQFDELGKDSVQLPEKLVVHMLIRNPRFKQVSTIEDAYGFMLKEIEHERLCLDQDGTVTLRPLPEAEDELLFVVDEKNKRLIELRTDDLDKGTAILYDYLCKDMERLKDRLTYQKGKQLSEEEKKLPRVGIAEL